MRIKILALGLVFIFLSGFISAQLSEGDIVYVIPGEKVFHLESCEKLGSNKTSMSVKHALEAKGFKPCEDCIISKSITLPPSREQILREEIKRLDKEIKKLKKKVELRRKKYVASHSMLKSQVKKAILSGDVLIGMNSEQVIASRGYPRKINKTTTRGKVREQWVMAESSTLVSKGEEYGYIYLVNDKVISWQSR